MERDHRRRTRVPIQLAVHVRVKDEDIAVTSKNISLKGLLCSFDPRLPLGDRCQVTLRLVPRIELVIQGVVVRTNPPETAIDFVAMDEDSFTHLKKIVEYNTENADRIGEELVQPAFGQTPARDE
jgi:hypothetical protein